MAKFSIYSKDGRVIRHIGEPQYNGSYMGVDFVEFRNISSSKPIQWEIGDYIDYFRTGMRYKLYSLPMPKKVARKGEYGGAFEYSGVQFFAATKELEIAPFRDLVQGDNTIHFSTRPEVLTHENVFGIARRIQECVNDIFPNRWKIEVYDTDDSDLLALLNETKEYSLSNGSCLDALSQIYETWKNVGWIHTYDSENDLDVITIGRSNVRDAENTSDCYSYGIGMGLTSIRKESANKGEFATRLYIYGSERNLQPRYYNGLDILNKDSVDIRNLMLPLENWGVTDGLPDPRKAYLQADDSIVEKYGLIPRTIYFDGSENEEIYPSIKGLTSAQVRKAMIDAGQGNSEYLPSNSDLRIDQVRSVSVTDDGSKESVEKNRTFGMVLNQVGFNIADQGKLTSEGHATISMKSGNCAGREFKVLKCERISIDNSLSLTLERAWDESIGEGYPNNTYQINTGDEFVLLDIPMPDYYIALAEERLLEAGEKKLADYTRVSAFYEPSIDPIKVKFGGKLLRVGMFMQVYDEDIIDTEDNTDYVLIDTLTIEENGATPLYRVTLREQKRAAQNYSVLEDMIEDAKEDTKKEISRARQYTDRRFSTAQETLSMLAEAFEGFTDGISPITIRTMSMLVGNESNQFKFTDFLNSLNEVKCPLEYDATTKQLKTSSWSYIKHMTLGINDVTSGERLASDYKGWSMAIFNSETLEDGQARYVYIKAPKTNSLGTYVLSKNAIDMEYEEGYYHFLVGILNSEIEGNRAFVTLYGFTEVLPGQITTDIVRSSNGNLVIDLVNALIEAKDGATIKGALKIEDGSLMTSRLDVGDNEGIEAFFNGGDFARDTDVDPHTEIPCGKLILAAGIPKDERSLEERAKEAKTRMYEDGCTYTKKLYLQDGCFIGGINVTNEGIKSVSYDDVSKIESYVSIEQLSGFVAHRRKIGDNSLYIDDYNYGVRVGGHCDGIALKIGYGQSYFMENCLKDKAALYIDCPTQDVPAILIHSGMIKGFRPQTRDMIEDEEVLSLLDHTIFAIKGTLLLPIGAEMGQVYKIYHYAGGSANRLYLKAQGGAKLRPMTGTSVSDKTEMYSDKLEVIEVVYGGANWYYTIQTA